ncbi:DUF4157 domain-containing protein [uncultured Kriegella sp.]|uniref:eCIS core domain-containing protein n=1 Tax=uncultured Kriegella sp. TaxID=1798910 RepID=UPI0030DB102A|tara:strand:+ start:359829 stop:364277 length:4449 start_codon:yes stop_codon:yes gene_type:complete
MFATAQKANAKPSNSSLFQRDKGSDAFIQPKLNIGKPGDVYEVEADRVAETVVARGNEQPSSFFSPSPSIQTQPQQEAIQEKSLSEDITPLGQNNFSGGVQEKCAECQEEENVQTQQIQRKGSGGVELPPVPEAATKEKELEENVSIEEQKSVEAGEKTVPAAEGLIQLPSPTKDDKKEEESPIQTKVNTIQRKNSIESSSFQSIESSLASSKGNGTAMPSATQREMSSGFGTDFSNVNIHTDSSAVHMNKALGAHAFTHGSDIYFNEGKYNPESESGKHLLAHELTHTVQQGAAGETVQRFVPTEKVAAPEGNPERPNDGAEVEGKSNSKINNDENVQDQDDLSDDEKRKKQDPPRGEVRQERSEVQSEGVSTPPVDRGAEALDTISAQREQMNEQLSEEGEGEAEGETTEVPTAVSNMGQADAAAQQSLQAEQMAMSVEIPEEPQPFRHPNVIAPVDSAGEAIPRQASIDTQVRGLGYIGEMLRGKGYEMIRHAAEKEIHAYGLDAVLGKQREDLALAKEGTQKIEDQNAERKEISEKSKLALDESIERQQFVAAEAPGLAQEADGGKSDSSALASDASSKSTQSQSEIPDDPDARADAEQQSGEMEQTAQGAQSMDDAITQTGERARQYGQDAEVASQDNEQSQASIQETDATIALIDGRSAEMTAQNEASNASIENAGPGPALIRQHAQQTAASGEELISASIVMELELIALQDEYLNSMAVLESKEAAEQRIQEEQEQGQDQPDVSPEEQQLYELGAMSDEEQEQSISQMTEEEKTGLMAALDSMIASAPDNGTDATEGARTRVDLSGVNNAISSAQSTLVRAGMEGVAGPVGTAAADALGVGEQPPPDPRAPEIQEIDNQRTQRVGGVLDIADQNMNFLTQQQQQQLAERLVGESITDDIKNINILQMGRDMLLGMVNPAMALQGVVGGFEKTFTGVANIFNAEAWAADPLGNLLQVAADISTGLAMIFSSILGIAGMITALMIALTIISWGTLSPITAPVIGWMGTVMTYAGWGAIVSGLLSVYFNSLAYIKNLHDAGTAETARELFGNAEQMKQNTTDGFQGAMAVVEGIGAVKMGPSMSNGDFMANVPRSPGAFARQTIDGAREGLSSVASLPGHTVRGARRLLGSGRQGLITFKNKITGFFRRSGRLDIDSPARVRTTTPDGDSLGSFQGRRVNAEMDLPEGHRARVLDDGQCAICSNCERIRGKFGDDLDTRPEMDAELRGYEERLRNNPNDADAIDGQRRIYNELTEAQTERISPRVRDMEERIANGDRNITREEFEKFHRDRRLLDDNMDRIRDRYREANPSGDFDDARIRQEIESGRRLNEDTGRFRNPSTSGSKRRQYLGSTPRKSSSTGIEVKDRMRSEGRLRDNPLTGREEVLGPIRRSDGTIEEGWFDIDDADMGHHPVDAVDFWNDGDPGPPPVRPGRESSPRSPEVRAWMTDSSNYELQHFGYNRSLGGQTSSRYQPPINGS